jgi:hypothetical protein
VESKPDVVVPGYVRRRADRVRVRLVAWTKRLQDAESRMRRARKQVAVLRRRVAYYERKLGGSDRG